MRILQLFCRYQERGGEEIAVESIGRQLRQRHVVEELYFDNAGWAGARRSGRWLMPFRFFWNAEACRRFQERADAFRPDLILVHNLFPAGSAGVWAKAVAGAAPVMYFTHNFRPYSVGGYCWAGGKIEPAGLELDFWPEIAAGAWQNSRFRTGLYASVLKIMHWSGIWRRVGAWIAISGFMRQRLVQAGVSPDKIHLLPHAWEMRPGGVSEAGSGGEAPQASRFLFLGRLSEEKGVPVLLEAWRLYCASGGGGSLTIAGTGPLSDAVGGYSSPDYPGVTFAGQVSGSIKQDLLDHCTALVVPSVWWEPLGLVVYEAYEAGKPVLAASSGGLAEIVFDGITGWVHDPGDIQQLSCHMLEASRSPHEVARRGSNGHSWLKESASVESWLEAFEGIALPLIGKASQSV